jgi:hypothetical protein
MLVDLKTSDDHDQGSWSDRVPKTDDVRCRGEKGAEKSGHGLSPEDRVVEKQLILGPWCGEA